MRVVKPEASRIENKQVVELRAIQHLPDASGTYIADIILTKLMGGSIRENTDPQKVLPLGHRGVSPRRSFIEQRIHLLRRTYDWLAHLGIHKHLAGLDICLRIRRWRRGQQFRVAIDLDTGVADGSAVLLITKYGPKYLTGLASSI